MRPKEVGPQKHAGRIDHRTGDTGTGPRRLVGREQIGDPQLGVLDGFVAETEGLEDAEVGLHRRRA